MIVRLAVAAPIIGLAAYLLWSRLEEDRIAASRCAPLVQGSNLIVCPAITFTQSN